MVSVSKPTPAESIQDESADLLTTGAFRNCMFIRSENDLPHSEPPSVFSNSPLIYSEPALTDCIDEEYVPCGAQLYAVSDPALPHVLVNDSGISSLIDEGLPNNKRSAYIAGATPKSSFYLDGSHQSVLTAAGSLNVRNGHKQSFSTREIREQHAQIQKKYRPTRKRHFTDPVDFEGLLKFLSSALYHFY